MNAVLSWPVERPKAFLLVATAVWIALYTLLVPVSEAIVAVLPVDRASHLGSALQFFFYDTPKILLLLTGVVLEVVAGRGWGPVPHYLARSLDLEPWRIVASALGG